MLVAEPSGYDGAECDFLVRQMLGHHRMQLRQLIGSISSGLSGKWQNRTELFQLVGDNSEHEQNGAEQGHQLQAL
jgi:hypothetical protein